MTGLLLFLALGLAISWAAVVLLTARTLSRPPRRGYGSAVSRGLPGDPSELDRPAAFDEIHITGLSSPAWMIRGDDPSGPIIVATHGWGRAKQESLTRFEAVRSACSAFLAWDMPGHGDERGTSALGLREWALLIRVVEACDTQGGASVVLWGWSMGAGVSIEAAARIHRSDRVAAVVAEAPYRVPATPARNVLRASGLPHTFTLGPALLMLGARSSNPTWRGFDRRALAAQIDLPLLVLHGSEDAVSPIEDGRAIAEAAPHGELSEIPSGTHNGLWVDEHTAETCRGIVIGFLGRLNPSRPPAGVGVESAHEDA